MKRWKIIFIREKTRFYKGFGELTALRQFVQIYLLIKIYIEVAELPINDMIILIGGAIGIIGIWFFGLMYDRMHLITEEIEFSNRRNPFVKEMRKNFKKRKT